MIDGRCPNCGVVVTGVSIKPVTGHVEGSSWRVNTYSCESCGVVLGAELDPVALKTEILEELVKRLGGA